MIIGTTEIYSYEINCFTTVKIAISNPEECGIYSTSAK